MPTMSSTPSEIIGWIKHTFHFRELVILRDPSAESPKKLGARRLRFRDSDARHRIRFYVRWYGKRV